MSPFRVYTLPDGATVYRLSSYRPSSFENTKVQWAYLGTLRLQAYANNLGNVIVPNSDMAEARIILPVTKKIT